MKILVAGDIHGDLSHCAYLIRCATEMDIDTILQLGDFGYWPRSSDGPAFLTQLEGLLQQAGCQMYFIDGNHDDHVGLANLKNSLNDTSDGFPIISPNLFYIPRGHVWEWGNSRCMGVGGAYSIDRHRRIEGESWFHQEVLTNDDIIFASDQGKVDVMFAHDLPPNVDINRHLITQGMDYMLPIPESDHNRQNLGRIVAAVSPAYIFHGHMHVRYKDTDFDGRTVVGLNCNRTGRDSWIPVEL